MTRRFEVGPILVALGAIGLLVSLFMDWYGPLTAWEAFEVVEVLLAALAITALVIAVGMLVPALEYLERRWLPLIVLGVAMLVAAELVNPPPAAGGEVVGRWSGLEGRRLGRPVLRLEAEGRRRRLAALPGGQLVSSGEGEWRASF